MKSWKQCYLKDLSRYGDAGPDKDVKKLLKYFRKCQFSTSKLSLFVNRFKFRNIKSKRGIELFGKTIVIHLGSVK